MGASVTVSGSSDSIVLENKDRRTNPILLDFVSKCFWENFSRIPVPEPATRTLVVSSAAGEDGTFQCHSVKIYN